MIRLKAWLLGVRGLFSQYTEKNGQISKLLGRNVPLMTLYQDCSSHHDLSKKMAASWWGLFSLYIYIENFKIFLSETTGLISVLLGRNVPWVTLYQDCSNRHDSSKNMAARKLGLFSLYIYIEKFKNHLVRNT